MPTSTKTTTKPPRNHPSSQMRAVHTKNGVAFCTCGRGTATLHYMDCYEVQHPEATTSQRS